ncbi:helix-turn-helix domain-containing protein [Oceanobacillus sp. CAU 1775]
MLFADRETGCEQHVTEIERGQIAAFIVEGLSLREIGRRMERNPSTISRERKSGTVQQMDIFRKFYTKYFPDTCACVYGENRKNCRSHSTVMMTWEFIGLDHQSLIP